MARLLAFALMAAVSIKGTSAREEEEEEEEEEKKKKKKKKQQQRRKRRSEPNLRRTITRCG